MKFKDLSNEELVKKVRAIKATALCFKSPSSRNYYLIGVQQKPKQQSKSGEHPIDAISEYHKKQQSDYEAIRKAQKKLDKNNFYGRREELDPTIASLKLHLNLNDIGELDELVILGLINFLIEQTDAMTFHFKIVAPIFCSEDCFKTTDQITIYFEKYSPVADMICLAQKIEDYLRMQNIPENRVKIGSNDVFGFNCFVSARFDTNRLLKEHGVYPFFDFELEKFLKNHPLEVLKNIPLGTLDAVFNVVITSEQITKLRNNNTKRLSDEDSNIVQQEFEKLLSNPMDYMGSFQHQPVEKQPDILIQPPAALEINTQAGAAHNHGFFRNIVSKLVINPSHHIKPST